MDIVIHPIQFRVPAGFTDYSRYVFTHDAHELEILVASKRGESLRALLKDYIDRVSLLVGKHRLKVGKTRPVVVDGKRGVAVTLTVLDRLETEICEFFPMSGKQYVRLFFRVPAEAGKIGAKQLAAINRAMTIGKSTSHRPSQPAGWIRHRIGSLQLRLPPEYEPPSTFFMQDEKSRLNLSLKAVPAHMGLLEQPSDLELFGIPERRAQLVDGPQALVESPVRRYLLREPEPQGESVSLALTGRQAAGPLSVAVFGRQRDQDTLQQARLEQAVTDLLRSVGTSRNGGGASADPARVKRSPTTKKRRGRRPAESRRRSSKKRRR